MTQLPRILMLTAGYGAGHELAAYAIKEYCHRHGLANVQIIDLMKEAHPLLNKISTAVYMSSFHAARFGINYYGWSYYLTQKNNAYSPVLAGLNRLGIKQLFEIIKREKPDGIINTFPYGASAVVSEVFGIPTFTIMTDYVLHARWLHPTIDKYYVASEDLKSTMIAKGINEEVIEVTGIPIRDVFEKNNYSKVNKNNKMILIIVGAYSQLDLTAKMIKSVEVIRDCHFTVVCGRNAKLKLQLTKQFQSNKRVTILGFVEQMDELMASATCIISKAGGLTLTESLALNIPLFVYRPFAGQEKDNATYFSEKGIAFISYRMGDLVNQIRQFVDNETCVSLVKTRMDILHHRQAAERIVKDVLSTIFEHRREQVQSNSPMI
ncbi:MGDG synthase family glycosyltransferase [Paenibacillus sp. WC2504]|uniref:MGDG synthase family glycosyltransferase n=1 Tax=Paenibacillus sp. WC2504 TaxID=3461403 RepID=UPI00404654F9